MKNIHIELESKELKFVIEAVEFQIDFYDNKLKESDIDEDEAADIENDRMLLQMINDYLKSQL